MDPLVSLHYYAPVCPVIYCQSRQDWRQVCALINACFIPFTEGLAPFRELSRIGPLILLSNAGVAFGLNVAAVFLIGAAGGLVLTLAGVFKVCPQWGEGWCIGYLVDYIELFVLRKCDHTYTDPWYVSTNPKLMLMTGYALALAGLMTYKNASSKS